MPFLLRIELASIVDFGGLDPSRPAELRLDPEIGLLAQMMRCAEERETRYAMAEIEDRVLALFRGWKLVGSAEHWSLNLRPHHELSGGRVRAAGQELRLVGHLGRIEDGIFRAHRTDLRQELLGRLHLGSLEHVVVAEVLEA
ncbi:MAG: hypothetical protein R3F20_02840 [Planctomycetota bacterium]